MRDELYMHHLDSKLGANIKEQKSPEHIKKIFAELGYENITDDIANRLSLLSRNAEKRGSHFQDAMYISEIIADFQPESAPEEDLNTERIACLLHDIGKSGPKEALPEEQEAFIQLFNLNFYQRQYDGLAPQELPLKKALDIKIREEALTRAQADKILNLILSAVKKQTYLHFETKISANTPMGTIWSAHVYWTHEILKTNERSNNEIDRRVTEVASSHHLLDDHDPMRLGIENADSGMASLELADKYQAFRIRLILADKYQAFRERGALNHQQAVAAVRKMIDDRLNGLREAHNLYLHMLDILDQNKDRLEKKLDIQNNQQ